MMHDSAPLGGITLWGQFRRHVWVYAAGFVVLALFQLAMNRIDWLSKAAVDAIFSKDPRSGWEPATGIFALAIFAFGARLASRRFIFNAGRDIEYQLRATMLAHLHRLGAAFYRTMSAGEIMSRATNDLTQVRLLFGFGILNLVNVIFAFASALQVMLVISAKLALASLVNLPILVIVTRRLSQQMFARNRDNQDAIGKLSAIVQANLSGVRVVRSFALEEHEAERFEVGNKYYLDASLALARVRGSLGPAMGAASALGVLVFFWYGSALLLKGVDNGGISKGDFFAFWLALGRMTWPMVALGFSLSMVQRGRAGFSRLLDVFTATPEIVDGTERAPSRVVGALRVRDLSFKYGSRLVVDNVSFDVEPGQSLAIVGKTGAGKSTLAMLLARLLPTPKGAVSIDGRDVCSLPLSFVRSVIGYAQQDAFLFSTTVARNIGLALNDAESPEAFTQICDAATGAQVLDEIATLPEQFETVVGERGVQLSGGQKQRVALARSLLWGPRILILDDPMSAVDTKTEAQILRAIAREAKKRTVVLITHRIAAAARCDAIVVMDNGAIVERGKHQDLVRGGGLYASLAEEQQMARELEELDDVAAISAPAPALLDEGPR